MINLDLICFYRSPSSALVSYKGTDGSLLSGHDAPLIWQIINLYYHVDMVTHDTAFVIEIMELAGWISFVCLNHINVPVQHIRFIGTDRSLLTGHNTLLLWQIAKDLFHALPHRHDNIWTAFGEPVVGTGGDKLISRWQNSTFLKQRDRTWTAHFKYRDASHYSISLPPLCKETNEWMNKLVNQSINQSIDQSINQPTNQTMNQPISQSTNQSMTTSTYDFNAYGHQLFISKLLMMCMMSNNFITLFQ